MSWDRRAIVTRLRLLLVAKDKHEVDLFFLPPTSSHHNSSLFEIPDTTFHLNTKINFTLAELKAG